MKLALSARPVLRCLTPRRAAPASPFSTINMELFTSFSPLNRLSVLASRGADWMNVPEQASPLMPDERPRVLLVEGDMAMRALLVELLAAYYQVEAVNDGLAAWQAIQQSQPDLILVDLYNRGQESLLLIRSLRSGEAAAALPIILLTTCADRELMLRCLEAGASNFLLKPFGVIDLLECLKLELELRAPSAARRA